MKIIRKNLERKSQKIVVDEIKNPQLYAFSRSSGSHSGSYSGSSSYNLGSSSYDLYRPETLSPVDTGSGGSNSTTKTDTTMSLTTVNIVESLTNNLEYYMYLKFDGSNLYLMDNKGNIFEQFKAKSGSGDKYKPLPEGEWRMYNIRESTKDACIYDGVGFWGLLEPQFKTDRTAIGIHPDGNKLGTAGCIGIRENANKLNRFYELVHNYLYGSSSDSSKSSHDFIKVIVDY